MLIAPLIALPGTFPSWMKLEQAAPVSRRSPSLTKATTEISRSPHTACSSFIHEENVPGRAMITAMAMSMTALTIRRRRNDRAEPSDARTVNLKSTSR